MRLSGLIILLGVLAAFPAGAQAPAKVKVVATFSILGDFVRNVGADRVELTVLVPAQGDVHMFEPAPAQNIALAQSDVIFENGFHLEPWLEKMYQASGSRALRVVVSDGVEPLRAGHAQEDDPHIWQNVSNAMVMVERIREGLSQADPANAAYYKEKADEYLDQLGRLDDEIIEALKDIPDGRRQLVTSHDSLGYFAKRYGFSIIGAGLESATTEASDPSAAQIAALIKVIKSQDIHTVFIENMHSPKLLSSIAEEAQARVAPPLFTDALGQPGSEGDSYIKMMRYNAKVFAQELK